MGVCKKPTGRGRAIFLAISAIGLLGLTTPAAFASGGGGGSMSPTPSGPRVDPAQSYRDGVAALEAGDYKKAEKKFGEVLSVARKHPEANYYMGLAKIGRGKEKSSVKYFKRAIKARDNFVEAREQLALVSLTLDDREEAMAQLAALQDLKAGCGEEECTASFRERLDGAIAKVDGALSGGEDAGSAGDEATSEETEEVSWAPSWDSGAGEYREAVKLINQDRYQEAIASLYLASANIGPHPDIYNYLGFSHRKLGKFDEAKAYYAQALKLAPDHLGATEYLGELYLELGQIKKAKRQLARLEKLCDFGCAEREELASLIEIRESVRSAARD